MSHEYRNAVDIRNTEKINSILNALPEYVEDFYIHLKARKRSTNTMLSYFYELNVFFIYVATLKHKEKPSDVTLEDLDSLRLTNIESYISNSEDGIDLSVSARRRKLSVLKSFYKYYLCIGSLKNDPTLSAINPKQVAKDVIYLSDSQVSALLNCIQNQTGCNDHMKAYNERLVSRDLAIIKVFLGTGMRISELVGLNISDIDTTETGKVYLNIVRKGGDEDKVRVIQPVYNTLADYIEFSRPLLVDSPNENALFVSTRGKRISTNGIRTMLEKYCKAAGLPDNISPHKMRATFATTVYAQTKDVYAIKDALHHSSIETSKHYISGKEQRIDKAAEAAGVLFQ